MRRVLILLFVLVGCTPATIDTAPLPTLAPLPEEVLPLFFWETASGQAGTAGDVDYWQFGGEAGDDIFIRAVTRGISIEMTLLKDSAIIAEGNNEIEMTLPAGGLYRVQVTNIGGTGDYDIGLGYSDQRNPADLAVSPIPQVVGVPTPTPPFSSLGEFILQLDASQEYAELLTANAPQHVYTIRGIAGQIVNFELYKIAGTFDPVLRFYDADGNLLAMDDNSLGNSNARLLNLRLPQTGLYSVQVDGKGLFGDYTLVFFDAAVAIEPDPLPTFAPTSVAPYQTPVVRFAAPDQRLDDHVPSLNSITRAGDFQRFSFFADAGERYNLVVEPLDGSNIIPQVEVFDPDGAQLAFSRATEAGADGAAVANGIIAQTGAHIVIVTTEDNTTGQFLVSFGRGVTVRDVFQGFIPSNTLSTNELARVGSRHIWELPLNPGDVISVAASPGDASILFDPVVELVTANGDVIARDDDGGVGTSALIRLVEIIEPATYLLRVYDEGGVNTGAYTLQWNYVNLAPTATPIPSLANILVVNEAVTEGQYQFYAFQGQAGQTVLIETVASEGSALDPVMAILDPGGNIVLEVDDSENSLNPRAILTLPEDGTYQVRVNGYLSSGQFELTVAQVFD